MKRISLGKQKLKLNTEMVRSLSKQELSRVGGGEGVLRTAECSDTIKGGLCSVEQDCFLGEGILASALCAVSVGCG